MHRLASTFRVSAADGGKHGIMLDQYLMDKIALGFLLQATGDRDTAVHGFAQPFDRFGKEAIAAGGRHRTVKIDIGFRPYLAPPKGLCQGFNRTSHDLEIFSIMALCS